MNEIIREPIHIQTADEIFEELGIKKEYENDKGAGYANYNDSIIIEFLKEEKLIHIDTEIATISIIRAINKKAEELKW